MGRPCGRRESPHARSAAGGGTALQGHPLVRRIADVICRSACGIDLEAIREPGAFDLMSKDSFRKW